MRQMSVYLFKDNQKIGPLPDAEVIAGLQSGTFSPNDHGWRDGMTHRVLLSDLFPPSPPLQQSPLPPQSPQSQASQPWAVTDLQQGMAPPRSTGNLGDDAGMRLLLPVGQSGWAVAAGYFGLFSLIVLPAPIALILGIVALLDIKKSKTSGQRKHGTGRAVFGLVMGVLGTGLLLWAVVAALLPH